MTNRTEIDVVEKVESSSRRKNYIASHPSFGFLSASVINCSKPHEFASSRASYDKYISFNFQTCTLAFNQYNSRVWDQNSFCKMSIAPHDFVRFLSSVYTGDYISVELTHQKNTSDVIEVAAINSELELEKVFKDSLSHAWEHTLSMINSLIQKIEDHFNQVHKLSAKELKETKASLEHAVKNMSSNAEFGLEVWDEHFDKLENEVLLEVDGLLVNQLINHSVSDPSFTENFTKAIGTKGNHHE